MHDAFYLTASCHGVLFALQDGHIFNNAERLKREKWLKRAIFQKLKTHLILGERCASEAERKWLFKLFFKQFLLSSSLKKKKKKIILQLPCGLIFQHVAKMSSCSCDSQLFHNTLSLTHSLKAQPTSLGGVSFYKWPEVHQSFYEPGSITRNRGISWGNQVMAAAKNDFQWGNQSTEIKVKNQN